MNINSIGGYFGGVSFTNKPKTSEKTSASYDEELTRTLDANVQISETAKADEVKSVSTADMTLDEYKQYIYDKISEIPMSYTTMQDNICIRIPDKGFENMQKDPEFEQWVLDGLKEVFSAVDPWNSMCGGKFQIITFGTEKGQYHGESFRLEYGGGAGKSIFESKARDSFWQHRAEKTEEYLTQRAKRSMEQRRVQQRHAEYADIQKSLVDSGSLKLDDKTTVSTDVPLFSAADILLNMENTAKG